MDLDDQGPGDDFFATPEEIEAAKKRIHERGLLPTVVRNAKSAVLGVASGLERGLASLTDTGPSLGSTVNAKTGAKIVRDPTQPTGGQSFAKGARMVADLASDKASEIKEEARKSGALHRFKLPFMDSEITDLGMSNAAGNFGGAAVPYMVAGAVPELAAPALYERVGALGKGLLQTGAASPLTVAQAAHKDDSSLGALAKATGNKTLDRAAESFPLRAAAELGLDALGNVGGEALAGIMKRKPGAAELNDPPKQLGPGHYEMGGATVTSRDHPEADVSRLLPSRTGPEATEGDALLGPGIPGRPPMPTPEELLSEGGAVPPSRQLVRGPVVTPAPLSIQEKLRRLNFDPETKARVQALPVTPPVERVEASIDPATVVASKSGKKGKKPPPPDGAAPASSLWERTPPKPTNPQAADELKAIEELALSDTSPTAGRLQATTFSNGEKVITRYRVVDRAELAPSHTASTFQRNPDATPGIQGRSYDTDPGAQASISQSALEFDPDRALNAAINPEEGPPVVTSQTNAAGKRDLVAGNGRVLVRDRAAEQAPQRVAAYRDQLLARAGEFGIDPRAVEGMREPVLVRELMDPSGQLHTPENLARMNNLSDRVATKIKSRGDEAATRAGNLEKAPAALEHFAASFDPEGSLADYLTSAPGRDFYGKLVEGGVIGPAESRAFLNARGELDDAGRSKLQDMLRASVLEDPRLAERGGQYVKKLDGAIPSLALVKTASPEWSLGTTVKDAIGLLQESQASGMRSVRDMAGQGNLLGGEVAPDVLAMAEVIEGSTARELRDRFRAYAQAAQESSARGQSFDMFPDQAPTASQLRAQLFGIPEGSHVSDGIEHAYAGIPKGWLTGLARHVRDNAIGTGLGAVAGATTADDEEGPVQGAVQGGLLGMLGQKGVRLAMRALETAKAPPEAVKAPTVGEARTLADRVSGLGPAGPELRATIPVEPIRPVSPKVTEHRPELMGNDDPRNRSARGYFNIPRLNLEEHLQDELAHKVTQLAGGAQGVPKEVISNRETTEKAAKLLGNVTAEELGKAVDWRRMSDVEGVALASVVGERMKGIAEAVEKLKDPALPAAERKTLEESVVRLDAEANQYLRTVMKGASQQGRDLQANKILANLRSPEAAAIKAQRHLGDRLLTPDEKTELARLVNAGDESATAAYIAGLRKSSLPEQLVVLRKAGLLTSLRNRGADVLSNFIGQFEQQGISKPVQVLTDYFLAKQTGERTRFHGNRDLYRKEVGRGLRSGITQAAESMGLPELTRGGLPSSGPELQRRVTAWIDRMRKVEISPEQLEKFGIPKLTTIDFLPGGPESTPNRLLDAYQKGAFAFAGIPDKIAKTAIYRGALVDAAESIAHAEKTPAGRFKDRVRELLDAPNDEMRSTAILEAERLTFQNSEFAAKFANGVKNLPAKLLTNPAQKAAVTAAMDWLFPFIKTGANIGARMADYGGLAGARAVVGYSALRKAIAEGADPATIRKLQKEITTLTGRATTGGMAMYGLGLWAYNKGLATGAYPSNPGEREQWRLEGKQANSIDIGGEWMPLARLTPLGGMVSAGANLATTLENGDLGMLDKLAAVAGSTARTSLDQPLVTGTKTLLDAVQDPSRFGDTFAKSQAASAIPTAVADLADAMDDGVSRKATTATDAVKERIPGLRNQLPERVDVLGGTTKGREGAFDIFANPLSGPHDRSADPITKLLRDTGARVTAPKQEKGETPAAFAARSKLEGLVIRNAIEELRSGGTLDGLGLDEQVHAIGDAVETARRDIREQLRDEGILKRTTP